MVNSKNNVSAILNALERGAFYSSCGPELHDFYVENGKAHVVCSPAAEIVLCHLRTPYLVQRVIPKLFSVHIKMGEQRPSVAMWKNVGKPDSCNA